MTHTERQARLEAYFATHPMLSKQAEAELRELERGTILLLERDDANCLYLSPEEVDPWVPAAMERLAPLEAQALQAAEREKQDDPGMLQAMANALIEVAREMMPVVFTAERLNQLMADLRDSPPFAGGKREGSRHVCPRRSHDVGTRGDPCRQSFAHCHLLWLAASDADHHG